MSDQQFVSESPKGAREGNSNASAATSRISDSAQQATEKAKQLASETASTVTHQIKKLLDRQVGSGAETVGHFANSAKRAAEDLDQNAPQLAAVVRGVAHRIEGFADEMRDQSVDQLLRTASDFTRRQPALVFGLGALAGFLVFRTLKNAPSVTSASSRHAGEDHRDGASQFYGT